MLSTSTISAPTLPRATPMESMLPQALCRHCRNAENCLGPCATDLNAEEATALNELTARKVHLLRDGHLYNEGEPVQHLYLLHEGCIAVYETLQDGREHWVELAPPNRLIGAEALGRSHQPFSAMALEPSSVCVISLLALERLSTRLPRLAQRFHELIGDRLFSAAQMQTVLGALRAEERLAFFLLSLCRPFFAAAHARAPAPSPSVAERFFGQPPPRIPRPIERPIALPMRRRDIGRFLGLKQETVSRIFSRFVDSGILQVSGRHVKILDAALLRELLGSAYVF